ncbi:MAG: TOMM precursor leader peptide-binding protein [bacterium]|nr:TOMM precursor leader peptide-binding protein [bacterium]
MVELGPTGCKVLLCLLEQGFRHFYLADSRPVLATDVLNDSFLLPEDIGQPRGTAVAARLCHSNPDIRCSFHPGPEAGFGWQIPWLAGCDVCLLCSDVTVSSFVFQVNAACLQTGVPLLPGLVMGRVGQIGPLVRAGKGPCLRCADLRITATTGHSFFGSPIPVNPAMAHRLSAALAKEVERVVAGGEDPTTKDSLLYLCPHGAGTPHPVLRTARCPDCSHFGPFMPYRFARHFDLGNRSGAGADPILRLRRKLVSPLTGPIRSVDRFARTAGDPAVEQWTATVADAGCLSLGRPLIYSGGCDLSGEAAIGAALGEGVERLASAQPNPADLFIAPYPEISDDAVDPLSWDVFHPQTRALRGFPFPPPSREQPMSWLWGYSLSERRPKAIPASRVFALGHPLTPGDRGDFAIVSGFAAADTLEEAACHGLLEVLERDAFMIAWANRLPMKRLEIDRSSPGQVGAYLATFEDRGLEARCSTVRLDLGAHLVVAIGRSSRPADPATWIAAAADPDLANACRRAIKELVASRVYVRGEVQRARGRLPLPIPEQVIEMGDHGLLYARPEMARYLESWWNPPQSVPLPEPQPASAPWAKLSRAVERITGTGLEVLVVDLTPPELKELGLWVVKALVPGTYPMNFDSRWPQLGGRRIREVPVDLGLLDAPLAFEQFHRVPHPFP